MSQTHRAVRYTWPGTAELKSVPTPVLQPHQILVKVHAAALNPVDEQLLHYPLHYWYSQEKGLGRDFSGAVEATTDEAWRVGEEVAGLYMQPYGDGTLAEKLVIDISKRPCIVKKPAGLTHEEAAGIPLVSLTARSCLQYLRLSNATGKVLVLGGSSSCGIWAIQLLKQANRHVVTTCSSRNIDFVKSLGAAEVIDYTRGNVLQEALSRGKYELIIDLVGGTDLLPALPKLLPRDGWYITIVGNKHERSSLGGPATYLTTPRQWLQYYWGKYVGPRWDVIILTTNEAWLQEAFELRAKRTVRTFVDSTFLFENWQEALTKLNTGRAVGKIVVKVVNE